MFLKFLKGLDIYGYSVGVHYRGDSSFKTVFGAMISLFSFILIIMNTVKLARDFVTKNEQKESVRSVTESLVEVEDLSLKDNKFEIIFGTDVALDPRYGEWKAEKWVLNRDAGDFTKIDLEIGPCDDYINEILVDTLEETYKER